MTEEEAEPVDHDESEADHDHEDHDHEGDHDHEDDSEPEGLQEGDFVRLEYTARTVESDQLVDTTDEDVAREEGIDTSEQSFGAQVVVLGEGHLFDPVERDVVGREVGDEGTVTVPAEQAFGSHDPDDVRTISADKIPEDDRYPGAHVTVEGEHGHVETIIGGRARVDFNHPLAGQDVEYDYEIVDQVEERIDRAKGLFRMYMDMEPEMWIQTDEVEEEVTVYPDEDEDDDEGEGESEAESDEDEEPEPETEIQIEEKETLYIEATPQLTMDQQWMFSKQQIARQMMDRLGLDRVIVQETIDWTGGQPGMMGGMMGGGGGGLEDADVDAEELAQELGSE